MNQQYTIKKISIIKEDNVPVLYLELNETDKIFTPFEI
jgi:hypothetical protein